MPKRPFFPALESLRGIAALLVVFYHIDWLYPAHSLGFIRNAGLMVDLFFVLSGFVMALSYGDKLGNKISISAFLSARFWRLYPLHLVFLFVFLAIELAKYLAETYMGITANNPAFSYNNAESFILNLLLLQSMGLQEHSSFNGPSWSISVEFYTYILFAVVCIFTLKNSFRTTFSLLLATLSLATIISLGQTSLTFNGEFSFFRCTYGFFIGVFAHRLYQLAQVKPIAYLSKTKELFYTVLLLSILSYLLLIKHDNQLEFFIPPVIALLILFLVIYPQSFLSNSLNFSPLLWLGKVSYSIYISHMAFIWLTVAVLRVIFKIKVDPQTDIILTSPLLGSIATIILVCCVLISAHFSFKYIEDPCRIYGIKRRNQKSNLLSKDERKDGSA
ncbi:acyltransferase 3 [Psychromonas sp. CNPT3]|uniref:acyltransferase family protein n=1 Tax=Psychromonas sp. CNPT3 TaxID=314282 RepID=UPI00006E895D|nr:acyltransferase [Psychromonas sp. CNPT3]AGH80486.1 acyltransferase 3 [Psychromonas sp. CNPT3]